MANGRGKNPNSRKALEENREKTQFRGEYAVRAGAKGNEVKRERKTWREATREAVTPEVMERIIATAIQQSIDGNANARDFLRDTMGEKPSDSVEINGASSFQFELKVIE